MREVIEALVADFEERRLPDLTPRQATLASLPGKIDAVVGMRRSGKTYLLFQHIEHLAQAGVSRDRCLYLNLEDERLDGLTARQLHLIPEAFYGRQEFHGHRLRRVETGGCRAGIRRAPAPPREGAILHRPADPS